MRVKRLSPRAASTSALLDERNGSLITGKLYSVFNLTESAHRLLESITPARLDDWNALSNRQRNCLRALFELQAFDAEARRSADEIAIKAEGRAANTNGFKSPLADLVRRGLVEVKTGRDGGYWLTRDGNDLRGACDVDRRQP